MSSNLLRLPAGSSSRLSRRTVDARELFQNFIATKHCYELVWGQPPVYIAAGDTVQIAYKVLARHRISSAPLEVEQNAGPSAVFNHRSLSSYLLQTIAKPSRRRQPGRPSSAMPEFNLRLLACSSFGPERPASEFASSEPYISLRQTEKLSVAVNHFRRNVSQVFVSNSRGHLLGRITPGDLLANFFQKVITDIDSVFSDTVSQQFPNSGRRPVNTISENVRHIR